MILALSESTRKPIQCLSEKHHQPWVAVEKQCGSLVTAHCTCMAGYVWGFCIQLKDNHYFLIVCSHVGAVLFKVEACVRLGKESATSMHMESDIFNKGMYIHSLHLHV